MKNSKSVGILLILGMIFSITVSHLPVLHSLLYHKLNPVPAAENASLTLSGIPSGKRIVLDGEWEFTGINF